MKNKHSEREFESKIIVIIISPSNESLRDLGWWQGGGGGGLVGRTKTWVKENHVSMYLNALHRNSFVWYAKNGK